MELSPTASEPPQSQLQTSGAFDVPPERFAHNVAIQLKDLGSKFDDDLGECGSEYVD